MKFTIIYIIYTCEYVILTMPIIIKIFTKKSISSINYAYSYIIFFYIE